MIRNALVVALMSAGFYRGWWTLDDDEYATVSPGFIRDAHKEWASTLPLELRAGTTARWVAETWDCDNIARDFGNFLSRCMAVDAVRTGRPHGNVAAGKINFNPTPDTGHAINWFVDHDGLAHCFDAGSGQMDHLAPEQIATIFEGEST